MACCCSRQVFQWSQMGRRKLGSSVLSTLPLWPACSRSEGRVGQREASDRGGGPVSIDIVVPQARRQLSRKAELLLELLAAGDGVEARIRAHSAEVDDLMLQLLRRRIEAAEKCVRRPLRCACVMSNAFRCRAPPLPTALEHGVRRAQRSSACKVCCEDAAATRGQKGLH